MSTAHSVEVKPGYYAVVALSNGTLNETWMVMYAHHTDRREASERGLYAKVYMKDGVTELALTATTSPLILNVPGLYRLDAMPGAIGIVVAETYPVEGRVEGSVR